MKKGQVASIGNIPAILLMAFLAGIFLLNVTMPVLNTQLTGNGSGTGGAVLNPWNNTGYPAALTIAQQLPVLYGVLFLVGVAFVALKFLETRI